MKCKIISMINWKGGVGKSTLTLHLGVGVKRKKGTKVLLVDLDPQCNLSFLSLGVNKYIKKVYQQNHCTLKEIFDNYFNGNSFDTSKAIVAQPIASSPGKVWKDVDVLMSHQELVLIDLQLARERRSGSTHKEETKYELQKLSIIYNALQEVIDDYEYIFLDCPPNINLVTQNALLASTHLIIPAIPDFLSTIGISLIRQKMDDLNRDFESMIQYSETDLNYTRTKFAGIIFNMVDEYRGGPKDTHQRTIDSVKKQHRGYVFDNYLTDGDGIAVAADNRACPANMASEKEKLLTNQPVFGKISNKIKE